MESDDLSNEEMSFSKENENNENEEENSYTRKRNINLEEKSFKNLLITLLENRDEEDIKQLLLLAIKKDIISENEIPIYYLMPSREERINRRRHSFTISEEYISSEKFSSKENNKLSIAKSERKKFKEKEILNKKKFKATDKHRRIIKLVESKYNDCDDSQASSFNPHKSMTNIKLNIPKTKALERNFIIPSKPLLSNSSNYVSIQKILSQHYANLSDFLKSGEVEPMYDYYLKLYHEIDEYNRLEISLKKEKKARRIYEQYIKKNAPLKVNLPTKIYELFEFKFTPIDNNLFSDVIPKITSSLSNIKSKFLASKYFSNKNTIVVPTSTLTRDSIGLSTKLGPVNVNIKQTLPENLQSILDDEEILLRFRLYLEKLFCDDALSLWLRIDHIVLHFNQLTQQELKETLTSYHREYIEETAPRQIAVTFQLIELWKSITTLDNISEKDIVKLVVNTREELSKELNNHVFDFLKEAKEQSTQKKQPPPVVGIESILKEDKVHDQLIKISINETLNKQFQAFLVSKDSSQNFLFWQSVEDLRSEAKESKRREKALVYYQRFISRESKESVEISIYLQNELEKMILNRKIYLEMKTFDNAQKQIEILLQPHIIEFLNLPQKSRQSLYKEQSSKLLESLTIKKGSKLAKSYNLNSKSIHDKLMFVDDDEVNRESFLEYLSENGVKYNFLFWSDTQKMLEQTKLNTKLKMVQKIYKNYLKDNLLRVKSNFKDELALFFQNNPKNNKIEEIPIHLFTNLIIEIEISLTEYIDQFINEKYNQN